MQEQFDLLKDIMDPDGNGTIKPQQNPKPLENNSIKEFANAARRGFRNATMVEGTPADGGYTVPEDIQTQINTYRDAKFSLISLVDVENVTTNKGQRT